MNRYTKRRSTKEMIYATLAMGSLILLMGIAGNIGEDDKALPLFNEQIASNKAITDNKAYHPMSSATKPLKRANKWYPLTWQEIHLTYTHDRLLKDLLGEK